MFDIDYIMELLDWNNSYEKQAEGIHLAQKIRCINAFFQPGSPYGIGVWENCAKVLSERKDEELSPYLIDMLEWLQDMNWPGAFVILERMKTFQNMNRLSDAICHCAGYAAQKQYFDWLSNIEELIKNKNIINGLPGDIAILLENNRE